MRVIRNNHPVASRWNSWNPAEKLSFLVTGSIFLPYYFAAVALCCGAFLVLVQPKQWGKVWAKSQRNWLLAMGALVILLPLWRKNWMGLGMGMLFWCILVWGLYLLDIMTPQLFERLLDLALLLGFLSFAYAIYQEIFLRELLFQGRAHSFYFNANYYAMMLSFWVLTAIYKLAGRPSRGRAVCCLLSIATNLFALYLANSFSAMVSLAVSSLVLVLLLKQRRMLLLYGLAAAGLLALILFVPDLLPRTELIPASFANRIDLWLTALRGIFEHPLLGQGLLTYHVICQEVGGYLEIHAHNLYLDILLNFGLLGSVVLVGYFWRSYVLLYRFSPRSNHKGVYYLAGASLLAILIHGINDVTILWIQTGMFWLLLLSGLGIDRNIQTAKAAALQQGRDSL